MRILIYDTVNQAAKSVIESLEKAGHAVDVVDTAASEAMDLQLIDYSIILKLCDKASMDCFDFIQQTRRLKMTNPIVLLTPNPSLEVRIKALNSGYDDCLSFPVDQNELNAKIFALVRRTGNFSRTEIVVDRLHLSLEKKMAHVDGVTLELTAKEYRILEFMCLRRGRTVTKETILNYLYGGMDEPEMKIIDVFICKLRKKIIQATGGLSYIKTVWGRGYCLIGPNDPLRNYGLSEEPADYNQDIFAA